MKDRNDTELGPGDWIIISANISTASQALLYGFVTKLGENRISIIRENGAECIKTYMRNSSAILKIPLDNVPEQIWTKILRMYNELE